MPEVTGKITGLALLGQAKPRILRRFAGVIVQMKLLRWTAQVSGLTFVSRVLGMVREIIVARVFGVSAATDAFYVAFKIPNLLRQMFAEGSFSTAFVPVLAEYKSTRSRAELQALIDHVCGALLAVLLIVVAIGVLAAPLVITVFAPGFLKDPERFALASAMLPITMPYILLIALVGFAGGILNAHQRFTIPALTPILLNIAMVSAAILAATHFDTSIMTLAYGVLAGGVIQLVVQIPALQRMGLLPRPRWGFGDPGVRKIMKLMVPTLFSSSVYQINLLIDTIIASFLIAGSISWLYQAERLLQFPQGVFGVALGTVILPFLSARFAESNQSAFSTSLLWGIRMVMFIAVPAALTLLLVPDLLIWTLFGYGKYTAVDVHMAGMALGALGIGLPAFLLIKVLAPGFFARQDTVSPVRAALAAMGTNIVLNAIFVMTLLHTQWAPAHVGLSLASALAGLLNASLLWRWLKRDGVLVIDAKFRRFAWQLVPAVIAIVLFYLGAKVLLPDMGTLGGGARVGLLALTLGGAGLVYVAALLAVGLRPRDILYRPALGVAANHD